MNRLDKKCLIASTGTHLFLFLLLIFGSAFFVARDTSLTLPPLKAVPTRLVDDALSGGGGNPKIAPSDAQQKGQTQVPQPPQPQPIAKPEPRKPEPKTEPKKAEPPKVKPPKEQIKETVKQPEPASKLDKTPPLILKPVVRTKTDKAKEQVDAEAREAQTAKKRLANELAKANERLKDGFSQGTKVDISGPGGEAYANYAQFVKSVYEDAWIVTDDLTDENSTAKVSVTIARSGQVISARMERRSGNSILDKSVQRALDKVKFVAPFPAGATDEQRTFLINFNLKAKRLLG